MGSSYFITYGGNRVTFPGTPGPVAWEYLDPMVIVDPLSNGYITMEFTTPGGDTITLDSQMSSASARVPVGSTAAWTAHAYSGEASSRNVLTAYSIAGFSGVSASIPVSTSLYQTPELTGYGSGVLTSKVSASAECDTVKFNRCSYGQGNDNWNTKISASSFAGNYDDGYGTAASRGVWIPEGGRLSYMASSITGRTFSFSTSLTALDNYGVNYNHNGIGTTGAVTGYMNEPRGFFLTNGRNKNVYATGTAYQINNTSAKSASVWRAYTIATAFSSNLSTGSALDTYLNTTAGAANVHGFSLRKELGQIKNSAGTWIVISGSNNVLAWKYASAFMTMSGNMSGSYSAVRAKGATANTTATASICGYITASGSYTTKTGTFKAPTASGNTATTTLTVAVSRSDGGGSNQLNVCNMFQSNIAQSTNLFSNCRGAWTASGRVE